jgi:nucleoside-diphosphate-sugar epimerase
MIHSDVVVLHLAAQIASDKREDFELNCVQNTQLILETMKNNWCERIFFFSSAAVLSSRKDWYAETKAESENLVVKSGLQYDIIRPSMMYGPFDNKNVGFLIQFMKKIPVFPVPGNWKYPRQPVFVWDVCQYVFSIFQQPASNNIVWLNGEVVNYIDMVTNIKKNIGLKSIIIKLPIWLFISLMVIYNTITRKVLFTPDQVKSLTSGDVFEDEDWWSAHNLERTSFPKGISKIRESKYFGYVLKR